MRIVLAAVLLGVGVSAACANRGATTPSAAAAGAARGAGAQAAARMTEADYDGLMKKVGTTNGTMRMKLMNNMPADAAKDAVALGELFGEVERFWTQHNKQDAVTWAAAARVNATNTAGAAAAGDGMKAQAAANNVLASCKECHGTYREGDQATGFRIKTGTLTQ